MTDLSSASALQLVGFGMNSPGALRLARFYEQAFGAQIEIRERLNEAHFEKWSAVTGGAQSIVLRLGDATIDLLEFDYPGRPYPRDLSPYDTRFQHLCIVVADMQRAMERLEHAAGWTPISGGPQTLPHSAGGVTAFKFRDLDGHPLEILQFRADAMPAHWRDAAGTGVYRGIDHSAMSVADVNRSVRFYESLGFRQSNRTLNQGTEQERLDGIPSPVVDVLSLALPSRSTPHLELLHYRTTSRPIHETPMSNDTSATRLIFAAAGRASEENNKLTQDPDGHYIQRRCHDALPNVNRQSL